jgi:hypothetical protein
MESIMNRETVGKISSDLLIKSVDNTHSAYEQMLESLTDFDKHMHETIDRLKKDWPSQDFYIVVITKKERLMTNVLRNYFLGRLSCPTPDYDQAVYCYKSPIDKIDFLWVIPSKDTCTEMIRDPLGVPAEENQLLKYVLDYADGTLFKLSKTKNGEV